MQVDIPTPKWAVPLLKPARYKVAYGGRATGKSHAFAENMIDRALDGGMRAVCIREVQNSIKDSVRQLLVDKIEKFCLSSQFEILEQEIRCPGNGLILFRGMNSVTADSIKSLENIDIAWVEEAQTLSARSLRLLRPTIRKPGSEIWFSYNPRFETDAVDMFFRGKSPPEDAVIIRVGWQDNPWLPDVMRQEMASDYVSNPEMAEHVWGGDYERITDASYYGKLIAAAERGGRIGNYPYDPTKPVMTSWDIGIDDYTATWFIQDVAGVPRVIDYYEASGLGVDEIFAQALPELTRDPLERAAALEELGRERKFTYGTFFFPHDIAVREWGGGGRSRAETVMSLGVRGNLIHKGAAMKPDDRINAVRQILPLMCFNQTERVMLGVSRLRRYRRKENTNMGMLMGPLHDENSHGCFVAGTLVETGRGAVAIEKVRRGDVVLTPVGWAEVSAAGQVGWASEFVHVETSDGRGFVVTPNHSIFTAHGLVSADTLGYSDVLFSQESSQCLSNIKGPFRETFSQLNSRATPCRCSTALGITDEAMRRITRAARLLRDICTVTCGSITTAPYRMDGMSITSMVIHPTTGLRTCKQWTLASIPNFTERQTRGLGVKPMLNRYVKPEIWLRRGIQALKASLGIERTVKNRGSAANATPRLASTAAQNTRHHTPTGPCSAPRVVRAKRVTLKRQPVYDLTVRDHHCYFANGILVSNSDAIGEFAVNWRHRVAVKDDAPDPTITFGGITLPRPPTESTTRRTRLL